jgi:4-amino-4-deoxy-L-arabinose transferase-like glycosyltransferase
LPTWLTAASGATLDFKSVYAMRLPVVAVTVFLVFVMYYLSCAIGLGQKHALQNALILITSFHIFQSGRDNQWDMYTHAFMLACILFIWKLFQEDEHQWKNTLLAGLFFGLSILSKGPVSIYVLFLPFLISYGIVYRVPFRKKWAYLFGMLIIGVVIGASWYVYVRLNDPETFRMVSSRETANWLSYRVKPFYYFWSFFLQTGLWAIPSLIGLCYPYLKSRVSDLKAYRFALLWTGLAFVFLSAVPEKKVRYLVPVLIPLALTTGFYIEYLMKSFNARMAGWEKKIVYLISGLIALIGFAYPVALTIYLKGKIIHYLLWVVPSSLLLVGCAAVIVRGLLKENFTKIFYAMIIIFTGAVVALFPLSGEFFHNPDYASSQRAWQFEKENGVKTYSLSEVAPQFIWDFGKPVPVLQKKGEKLNLPAERKFALIVDLDETDSLTALFPQYEIKKIYRMDLYSGKSRSGRLTKDYYLFTKING